MNCPSCNKNLASTLSVCPSCGTMVYDSVREELALKISPLPKTHTGELNQKPSITITDGVSGSLNKPQIKFEDIPPAPPIAEKIEEVSVKPKIETSELPVKPTSPTLVEFHNKNAMLPEWRLQLQNAVRMRTERADEKPSAKPSSVTVAKKHETNGATALKPLPEEMIEAKVSANPALDRALKRIEQSRQRYTVDEPKQQVSQSQVKTFPFAERQLRDSVPQTFSKPGVITKFPAKENVVSEQIKSETAKLPSLIEGELKDFAGESVFADPEKRFRDEDPHITASDEYYDLDDYAESEISGQKETEDFDDFAPISLRFNAAIFDLLIGSFSSLLLLSPFILANGNFFSAQGMLAFLATCSIVMFIYLTASIGFLGRTYGMKLFSLEIIDAEENAYPTLHQAAVSSSVYLVSLALGGLGFIPIFLNKEKRAAHDLLSGTIIIKEY